MSERRGSRENCEDDADVRNYHEKRSMLNNKDRNHQVPLPMAKGKNRLSTTGEMDNDSPAVMQHIVYVNNRETVRRLGIL